MPSPCRHLTWRKGADIQVDSRCAACRRRLTAARDPRWSCAHPTWVPFMSGYGGLSVVLFPNGNVYYNVADDGKLASFDWGKVTAEARKLGDFCQ